MPTLIKGGRVIDPANRRDGVGDVWMQDGRIVAPQTRAPENVHDARGKIVMAGAIDIHSHIAGGNVSTARLLLPEAHRAYLARPAATPLANAGFSTFETGRLYAQMGFSLVVEPAVAPHHALHAHLELADIPIIDKAILTVLGNDDFLLGFLRDGDSPAAIRDYVAATLAASKGLGIKVINAGAAAAFKYNARSFDLDDVVPHYGVSSRRIVEALQQAAIDLGVPHPVHVHANNLGLPGNVATAKATILAARGLPMHLAHLQFYAYGKEGPKGFSSAAAELAEVVNAHKNVTVDVGQVMFQPTVTVSSDVMRQYNGMGTAKPRKSVIFDGDSNGGGVVPFTYSNKSFFNAVQWACGLELFLAIDDPMRVFFTTDHPNGAPFTAYPDLFALLMSRDLRARWMASLPKAAMEVTNLPAMTREYTLPEISVMTRQAPAKLLGLRDRGHLGPGAIADVAVYDDLPDRAKMFRHAALGFKDGELVVREGRVTHLRFGRALTLQPTPGKAMQQRLEAHYQSLYGLSHRRFAVRAEALTRSSNPFEAIACSR